MSLGAFDRKLKSVGRDQASADQAGPDEAPLSMPETPEKKEALDVKDSAEVGVESNTKKNTDSGTEENAKSNAG